MSGPQVTIRGRIEQVLQERPGRTAPCLAEILFRDSRATSRLQFELAVLLSRGKIRREGEGGARDPHRYYTDESGRQNVRTAHPAL